MRPTTPHTQPLPGITRTRFSLIRYRSPLHTESQLFSSPTGTEMFHFPASTPTQTMYSPAGNTTQLMLGFPIRTSSDQRFVGNSPRHNAASHVLHRLSMPRHPPYARNKTHGHTNNQGINTKTQKRKILASTIQFSHNTTPTHNQPQPHGRFTQGPNRNNHMLPQTPNSAPTHIKPFVTQRCIHQPQHHAAQPHSASHTTIQTVQPKTDRCASTRQNRKQRGSHTLGDSTTHTHNCGMK